METLLAVLVGILFASGIYLVLRPNLLRLLFGMVLLSNAVNLLIFTAGRVTVANPPLIPYGEDVPPEPFANPLPQALVLTAIVIGFGLVVFALVLVYRGYQAFGTLEPDRISRDETPTEPEPVPSVDTTEPESEPLEVR